MTGARFDAASTWTTTQLAMRSVGAAISRWSDPRRKLLRQRRAALHTTVGLGSVTGAFTAGTLGLAVFDAPSLLVAGGCGVAVLVATPTAGAAMRLRRLYKVPLPPERMALPPRGSAARPSLRRLAAAETSLSELVRLLDADVAVPSWEVREVGKAAAAAAVTLRREAADLLALEHARDSSGVAGGELAPVVVRAGTRLERGVGEYERVVAAAARAVAVTSGTRAVPGEALQDSIDRIEALTQALAELAGSAPR